MLTVKQIDAAKPTEKSYRLADAGGLFLFVPPSGKKVWRMRFRFDGKEKTLVIGPYPEISLTEARAKQSEACGHKSVVIFQCAHNMPTCLR